MQVEVNKKTITIPDEEIQRNMKILDISQEEAIQMYLEDEGYQVNEEVENLTKKAKENKSLKIGARREVSNKKVIRERKANPVKEEIIQILAKALHNTENMNISNIRVENIGKIITFKVENREFKLDLVEKRQKKA